MPPPKPEKPSLLKRFANKITFGKAYQLEIDRYWADKLEYISGKDRYEAHSNRLLFEYGQMLSNVFPWDPHVMKTKVSELIDHDWNKSMQPALEEDAIGLEFETQKASQKAEIKLHELNTNAKKKPENISRERPSKAMNDPTMKPKEK